MKKADIQSVSGIIVAGIASFIVITSCLAETGNTDTSGMKLPLIPCANDALAKNRGDLKLQIEIADGLKGSPVKTKSLPVYRVVQPLFSEIFMKTFANCTLGTGAVSFRKLGMSTFVRVEKKNILIEFNHVRGSIHLANRSFVKGTFKTPLVALPVNHKSVSLAYETLEKYHLDYKKELVAKMALDNRQGAGFYTVVLQRQLPNMGYSLFGNRILVNVSPEGMMHSILIEWSDFHRIGDYPVLSLKEAVNQVNLGRGKILELERAGDIKGEVVEAKLIYVCSPEKSGYLQPFYRLDVRLKEDAEVIVIHVQAVKPEYLDIKVQPHKIDNPKASPAGTDEKNE